MTELTPPTIDLLRLATAGSVDDGKSTLIGRLLHDTKNICIDQMEAIEASSKRLGETGVNLALLTDGLRAEREQRITIDVAYRYFATPRRTFIIADTPGHLQYTRNMVTGASTADLAIVLVDARKGLLTQSRRHAFIASLLGIPHLIVAINKMDLVDWDETTYRGIVAECQAFAEKLTITDISVVPVSALLGDNVVEPSTRMPWYQGGPLLHLLETVTPTGRLNQIDFRFPVQTVIRPSQDFRGYAGQVASGAVKPGDAVVALPSGLRTTVTEVVTFDGPLDEAAAGDSVVLTLADEIDITRGDMIVRERNRPMVGERLDAYLCWMDETALRVGAPYLVRHTTREVSAVVQKVEYRVDVDTLHRGPATTLALNEIGRVELVTAQPLCFDSYRVNAATGSFILIDPQTNGTVGAGMIRGAAEPAGPTPGAQRSPNVVWEGWNIPRSERERVQGHAALVVWFTGPSGAGKTTIARAVERQLFAEGYRTILLDGDQLRHGLNGDLGFSPSNRSENIRRAGEVAALCVEAGLIVLCAFVSPYAQDRERVRAMVPAGRFVEVYVHASEATLRARDPKGLYAREAAGEVRGLSGVSAPYEAPANAELTIDTGVASVEGAVQRVFEQLRRRLDALLLAAR